MANGVMGSIIRNSNIIEDKPEFRRRKRISKRKILKRKSKSLEKVLKGKKEKKRPVKRHKAYAGYSNLSGHPLPHVDHEDDYMEHIGHEYKMR